jgi:hypothetical protein
MLVRLRNIMISLRELAFSLAASLLLFSLQRTAAKILADETLEIRIVESLGLQ